MAKTLPEKECTIKILDAMATKTPDVFVVTRVVPYKSVPTLVCSHSLTPSTDKKPKKIGLKRFSLRQIPKVMRKKGWNVAATLQDNWFEGKEFTANENHQKGKIPYPPENIDTHTITMAWLKKFPRVDAKIGDLKTAVCALNALDEIREIVKKNVPADMLLEGGILPIWKGSITQGFHKKWQFQHVTVDGSVWDKGGIYRTGPDDLYAALGTFSLNAAIAEIEIKKVYGRMTIMIPKIVIYVRDTYDFLGPQYLGHWNSQDLKIMLTHIKADAIEEIATKEHQEWIEKQQQLEKMLEREKKRLASTNNLSASNKIFTHYGNTQIQKNIQVIEQAKMLTGLARDHVSNEGFDEKVLYELSVKDFDGSEPTQDNSYFSVRNKHYDEWRKKHNQGKDVLIFSDAIPITAAELPRPLQVELSPRPRLW
jgi:hypothetical protein